MHTSIKNTTPLLALLFFIILPNLFSQDTFWEKIETPKGINTPFDDFYLIPFDNQLMFTRIVSNQPKQFILNSNASIMHYSWNQSLLKEIPIIYPMKHESSLFISTPYNTLTRSYLGIFELRSDGILYQHGQTDKGCFASHPWMTSDGQTLFFSSDREGSIGGADLWYYSKSPRGEWTGPFSMGDYINSSGDEIHPFSPHPDTLYYATNGHGGKGGFDILMSVKERGEWLEPIPIDEVNSEWDDTEFVILNDTLATYTSNKPGGKGKLDIYMLKKSTRINLKISSLAMMPSAKTIEQSITKNDNALAFRSFIFPRNNKLSTDDDVMLDKLTKQLLSNPETKVYLTMHPMTDKIIDKLQKGNVSSSRIIIDSSILESLILISMDSKKAYSAHPYVSSICEPQSFKLYISSTPENLMSDWEILYKDSTMKKGITLPDSIQFNTSMSIPPFQDSIVFHAKGTNIMGMNIQDSTIIPIQRQIVNLSETLDSNSIPVMWHMKDIRSVLPHFFRYAKCFSQNQFVDSKQEQPKHTQKNISLFVSDSNAIAIDNALKILKNEPELREFTISKVELALSHPLAKIIKLSITRAPLDEYKNVIPVLIH